MPNTTRRNRQSNNENRGNHQKSDLNQASRFRANVAFSFLSQAPVGSGYIHHPPQQRRPQPARPEYRPKMYRRHSNYHDSDDRGYRNYRPRQQYYGRRPNYQHHRGYGPPRHFTRQDFRGDRYMGHPQGGPMPPFQGGEYRSGPYGPPNGGFNLRPPAQGRFQGPNCPFQRMPSGEMPGHQGQTPTTQPAGSPPADQNQEEPAQTDITEKPEINQSVKETPDEQDK